MSFCTEIITTGTPLAFAAISFLFSSYLKKRVSKSKLNNNITLSIDGKKIKIPLPVDTESINTRIKQLSSISQRYAIIDGWDTIAKIIVDKSNLQNKKNVPNVIFKNTPPWINNETVSKLKQLYDVRNKVVHNDFQDKNSHELDAVINDLAPLISRIKESAVDS